MKIKYVSTIELTPEEEAAVRDVLTGRISARALARRLDVNHQTVLNRIASLCRQWVQDGTLTFTRPIDHQ